MSKKRKKLVALNIVARLFRDVTTAPPINHNFFLAAEFACTYRRRDIAEQKCDLFRAIFQSSRVSTMECVTNRTFLDRHLNKLLLKMTTMLLLE